MPPLDPARSSSLTGALASLCPDLEPPDVDNLGLLFDGASVARGVELVPLGSRVPALYLVLEGTVRAERQGKLLGLLTPGRWFGHLELLTGMPSPFSAKAETDVVVARLSFDRFRLLAETHADVQARFEAALYTELSKRFVGGERQSPVQRGAETVGEVVVRTKQGVRRVPAGVPVASVLPARERQALVVAALVDNRAVSLESTLATSCTVDALTTHHWEGQRVYRHSLALLALEAASRLDGMSLRIESSIGFAQRIRVRDLRGESPRDFAARVEAEMKTLVEADLPLVERILSVPEAIEYFSRAGFRAAQALLSTWREAAVQVASYGRISVLNLSPLVPRTGVLRGFCVLADDSGILVVYGPEASTRPLPSQAMPAVSLEEIRRAVPDDEAARRADRDFVAKQARQTSHHVATMTVEEEAWLEALGTSSVGELNRACIDGNVPELIRVTEAFQERRISQIADRVSADPSLRVVSIAGPSSSGKTTFIKRLSVQLRIHGITPLELSLDDYYVDRAKTPRTPSAEYDYESLEALRLELLREHVGRLARGESVKTARYDFVSGESDPEGGKSLTLPERGVLLLEGIHGLNPRLALPVDAVGLFRIFICPLLQFPLDHLHRIHVSDIRLLRRIVRDRHARAIAAAENLRRWPSVRAGERQHIFPYQHHADAVFDTSLIYEPSVLKVFAERYLLEVPQSDPVHATAFRLARLLDHFVAIYPDQVPPTSILREFIGGSGFEY